MSASKPKSQVWRPEHLRLAMEAASVALWSWKIDSDLFTMDARACELWGLPPDGDVAFEDLSAHIHPADRDRVRAAFVATRTLEGPFEIDFRILLNDVVRWISARGESTEVELVDRTTFGIFLDVTGRKQAEEGHELLAGEMSHRVKNLLSIASGLTTITSRSTETKEDMARELTRRLTALGRAHDLVRPLPGDEGKAALLGDLLSVLLAPYDDQGAFAGRIRVAVARMGVGETAATTLAMVIHELATNSVKHGALSADDGILDIASTDDEAFLVLTWSESGGPEVGEIPDPAGFGSRMIERSLMQQFAGALSYEWRPTGLVATLRLRKDRLAL